MPGSDIGYYFFAGASLKTIRETRIGNWKSVNANPAISDTILHTNHFFTLWFNHGINPAAATYAYVLLPGKSGKETVGYANNPQVTIIRNDTLVQAAAEKTLKITGANFWTDTEQSAGIISCNKKAAVMVKEEAKEIAVSLSDPTMLNTGSITLKINKPAKGVRSKSDAITVVQLRPAIIVNIKVAGAKGSGFEARFAL